MQMERFFILKFGQKLCFSLNYDFLNFYLYIFAHMNCSFINDKAKPP